MQQVPLGRSGLNVSRLAFGGLFVASFATEADNARAAVRRAIELGINYFDTAPTYGNSEEVLGVCLEGNTAPVIISTKIGGRPTPFNPKDRAQLLESVKTSLLNLKRDHIDLLMIHEPERPKQYAWWDDIQEVTGPVLDVVAQLKKEGVIRAAGIGGTTTTEMAHLIRSGKFEVLLTAFNYSLLWREAAIEVIPEAVKQGMGIIVGSALQQGALARKYENVTNGPRPWWLTEARIEQFRMLYQLVDESGIALPELGLRFVLSNPAVHSVLMGVRTPAEVDTNVAAAARGALPAAVLKRLDEIAAILPQRPYGEPMGIGWLLGNPAGYGGQGMA